MVAREHSRPPAYIQKLSAATGTTPAQARLACGVLFQELSNPDGDLGTALVRASRKSGTTPAAIVNMLRLLAEDLGAMHPAK